VHVFSKDGRRFIVIISNEINVIPKIIRKSLCGLLRIWKNTYDNIEIDGIYLKIINDNDNELTIFYGEVRILFEYSVQ
jgi:hypothetical protein